MSDENVKEVDWGEESWCWLRESPFVVAVYSGNDIAGQCEEVNGLWAAHVVNKGLVSQVETLDCFALPDGDVIEGHAHTVAVLDGEVWDWSYRQFDEGADVPVVVPLKKWAQRWRLGGREIMDAGRSDDILSDWEDR